MVSLYNIFVKTSQALLPSRQRNNVAETNANDLKANSEKRSYSVMEVAEILGVSKKSVYNMCANGTFKCVRIGTRLRISKKAFDDWLDGRDNT